MVRNLCTVLEIVLHNYYSIFTCQKHRLKFVLDLKSYGKISAKELLVTHHRKTTAKYH
jgi:hypothetical protein